jgi:hypothetical protein
MLRFLTEFANVLGLTRTTLYKAVFTLFSISPILAMHYEYCITLGIIARLRDKRSARPGVARGGAVSTQPSNPNAALLAQAEGVTHRPVSYASSPSLPGTINAPWWTDFAHLVYWFYVVATFATVAFLAYLYDLLVRRREAAHPVRETRGFSRAQTGDLVTAVLPLTWSATMVMHASTHSINFDENTAGAAFSFTVIAYQWG